MGDQTCEHPNWYVKGDAPPRCAKCDRSVTEVLAELRTQAQGEQSRSLFRLREERDSWRRTAERLEEEKRTLLEETIAAELRVRAPPPKTTPHRLCSFCREMREPSDLIGAGESEHRLVFICLGCITFCAQKIAEPRAASRAPLHQLGIEYREHGGDQASTPAETADPDCDERLDPFALLRAIAHREYRLFFNDLVLRDEIKAREKRVSDLEREEKNLRARIRRLKQKEDPRLTEAVEELLGPLRQELVLLRRVEQSARQVYDQVAHPGEEAIALGIALARYETWREDRKEERGG